MKSATIYTARGCPFKCTFCQAPQLSSSGKGKYVRLNSPGYISKEIQHLHDRYKVQGIFFLDDMFSITRKRGLAICNELINSGLNKKIKYVVQTRIDAVDDELMQALKDSGCFMILFGCETGSNNTLERMNKKMTVEKSFRGVELARKFKINCSTNILIGSPGETENDFLRTIQFLKKARPNMITYTKFAPLPGSTDYDNLVKRKILKSEYGNWDEIYEKYVESDFTFAAMPENRFKELVNKLNREIYLYTNSIFDVKSIIKIDFLLAIKKTIMTILHVGFLYLPMDWQKKIKKITMRLSYNVRYVFYEKQVRE